MNKEQNTEKYRSIEISTIFRLLVMEVDRISSTDNWLGNISDLLLISAIYWIFTNILVIYLILTDFSTPPTCFKSIKCIIYM